MVFWGNQKFSPSSSLAKIGYWNLKYLPMACNDFFYYFHISMAYLSDNAKLFAQVGPGSNTLGTLHCCCHRCCCPYLKKNNDQRKWLIIDFIRYRFRFRKSIANHQAANQTTTTTKNTIFNFGCRPHFAKIRRHVCRNQRSRGESATCCATKRTIIVLCVCGRTDGLEWVKVL